MTSGDVELVCNEAALSRGRGRDVRSLLSRFFGVCRVWMAASTHGLAMSCVGATVECA